MTNKKYVVVLRHGPTHSNESINYDSFVKFIANLIVYLKNFLINKGIDISTITPKIYSSPYSRCVNTAKFVASHLEVLGNKKIPVQINSGVTRWDIGKETREKSIERSFSYGDKIYKKVNLINGDELRIYITHSSIIPSLISGIVGKKLKKIKLHTFCLSIIDINDRKLEVFNKSFK
jgi:hypothetical protein